MGLTREGIERVFSAGKAHIRFIFGTNQYDNAYLPEHLCASVNGARIPKKVCIPPNPLMSFDDLREYVGNRKESHALIDLFQCHTWDILKKLGKDYDFVGMRDPLKSEIELVDIAKVINPWNNVPKYVPESLVSPLVSMAKDYECFSGEKLVVGSAYRSPAYQTYIICYRGTSSRENLQTVLKRAAPPGCSDHQNIENPAIDFANFMPDLVKEFCDEHSVRDSVRWQMFAKIAHDHGFYETYPDGSDGRYKTNNSGMGEPWHWGLGLEPTSLE